MQAKRVQCSPRNLKPAKTISKNLPTRPRSRCEDLLSALPTDLQSLILDILPPTTLSIIPKVHPKWSRLFHSASLQPHFRYYLRRHYNLNFKPSSCTWGHLYLQLRRESCHLCPSKTIQPFVYAASACLGVVGELITLFPVCIRCFDSCNASTSHFLPVVEVDVAQKPTLLADVNVHVMSCIDALAEGCARNIHAGFLYSDIPRRQSARKISFVYINR